MDSFYAVLRLTLELNLTVLARRVVKYPTWVILLQKEAAPLTCVNKPDSDDVAHLLIHLHWLHFLAVVLWLALPSCFTKQNIFQSQTQMFDPGSSNTQLLHKLGHLNPRNFTSAFLYCTDFLWSLSCIWVVFNMSVKRKRDFVNVKTSSVNHISFPLCLVFFCPRAHTSPACTFLILSLFYYR